MREFYDIDREQEEYYENTPQESQNALEQVKTVGLMNVSNIVNNIVKDVEIGNINPLDAYTIFKRMESVFNEAKKSIDTFAIDEAEKFGASSFEFNGQKYEVRNGATRFSFKGISEWEQKNNELKAIEEKYKTSYKSYTKMNLSLIDQETGEVIDLPTVTVSKSSLIVKK